ARVPSRQFGVRHNQGLLRIAADREGRGRIELQPPSRLRTFNDDEVMADGVRRWNRLGRRAADGDHRAFVFVFGGHRQALEEIRGSQRAYATPGDEYNSGTLGLP